MGISKVRSSGTTELRNYGTPEFLSLKLTNETKNSENPPLKSNGKKKGYMKIMLNLWEEFGYGHFGLTAKNLVDRISQEEKHKEAENIPISYTINLQLANVNITANETSNEMCGMSTMQRLVLTIITLDDNDKRIHVQLYLEVQKSLSTINWNVKEFTFYPEGSRPSGKK